MYTMNHSLPETSIPRDLTYVIYYYVIGTFCLCHLKDSIFPLGHFVSFFWDLGIFLLGHTELFFVGQPKS